MTITLPGWLLYAAPFVVGLFLVFSDKGSGGYFNLPGGRAYLGIALLILGVGLLLGRWLA